MRSLHILNDDPDAPPSGGILRTRMMQSLLESEGTVSTLSYKRLLADANLPVETQDDPMTFVLPEPFLTALSAQLESAPDLVVIDSPYLAGLIPSLRAACPEAKIWLNAHNIESLLFQEETEARFPAFLHPLIAVATRRSRQRFRRAESAAFNAVDLILMTSAHDVRMAREMYGTRTPMVVLGNPVPDWAVVADLAAPDHLPNDANILLVGHMGFQPNKAAVKALVSGILPRIHRQHPDVRLTVCGRGLGAKTRRRVESLPHGNAFADPESLAPHYDAAHMVMLPIRAGSGTRLKVLEAAILNRPIIATAKAVEGLDFIPDEHYLNAESNEEFAAAFERLLRDPALLQGLVSSAAKHVRTQFAPERQRAQFQEALAISSG